MGTQEWKLENGGKYFLTRNGTTLIAFVMGGKYKPGNGFNIVAAHTDRCTIARFVQRRGLGLTSYTTGCLPWFGHGRPWMITEANARFGVENFVASMTMKRRSIRLRKVP